MKRYHSLLIVGIYASTYSLYAQSEEDLKVKLDKVEREIRQKVTGRKPITHQEWINLFNVQRTYLKAAKEQLERVAPQAPLINFQSQLDKIDKHIKSIDQKEATLKLFGQ